MRAAASCAAAALPRALRARLGVRAMSSAPVRYATEELRPAVRDTLLRAQAVCFDVDSTVVTVEGIDELAAAAGKKDAVAALTAKCVRV